MINAMMILGFTQKKTVWIEAGVDAFRGSGCPDPNRHAAIGHRRKAIESRRQRLG
jgi:hypothetical protein